MTTKTKIEPADVSSIAREAYIFMYPAVENYRTLYDGVVVKEVFKINELVHDRKLFGPNDKLVVAPNNDTLYSKCFLNLRKGPAIFSVPAVTDNRYYSIQVVDGYTYNAAIWGSRTTGSDPEKFLIGGPTWDRKVPRNIKKWIKTESSLVFFLIRTGVNGPDDLPNAWKVQNQYKLQTSSPPLPDFIPVDLPKLKKPEFFSYANYFTQFFQQVPSEKKYYEKFAHIGVIPGQPFDTSTMDPDFLKAVQEGIDEGDKIINDNQDLGGSERNSWNASVNPPPFGTRAAMETTYHIATKQYIVRAAAARFALYGLDPAEAYYPTTNKDIHGDAYSCANGQQYTLFFSADQIPPVQGFWSITMYHAGSLFLVDNPIDRYSIGDRTAGLKWGEDGSLMLYIQKDSPGKDKESNWLPAPYGTFVLYARLYAKEALEGPYFPPPLNKV